MAGAADNPVVLITTVDGCGVTPIETLDTTIVRGAEILLESSGSEAAPVQIDGDPGGELPVRIGLVRRAQGFMVPSAPGGA